MIKTKIRKIYYFLKYMPSYVYDCARFVNNSNIEFTQYNNKDKLLAKIISLYHVIEKGLSMPNTKLHFGVDNYQNLITYLILFESKFNDFSNCHYLSALSVLKQYYDFNKKNGIEVKKISIFLSERKKFINKINGGTKILNKYKNESFIDVVNNRSSIRNFVPGLVPYNKVLECVKIAQKSPSSCNRQTSRIIYVTEKKDIEKILTLQSGARGFGHQIETLLLVCSDINYYQGVGDRMSGYIDSSLFAMTLLHSFTHHNIGTIALNWSKDFKEDIKLRKIIDIPCSYNVTFMIGLGYFEDEIKVPVSCKSNENDIVHKL